MSLHEHSYSSFKIKVGLTTLSLCVCAFEGFENNNMMGGEVFDVVV